MGKFIYAHELTRMSLCPLSSPDGQAAQSVPLMFMRDIAFCRHLERPQAKAAESKSAYQHWQGVVRAPSSGPCFVSCLQKLSWRPAFLFSLPSVAPIGRHKRLLPRLGLGHQPHKTEIMNFSGLRTAFFWQVGNHGLSSLSQFQLQAPLLDGPGRS